LSTTTLRLEKKLRARVQSIAKSAGTSPHSFMLEAIEEKAARAELQQDFHAEAEQRLKRIARTGQTVPWTDMRAYLEKRMSGAKAAPPKAKKRAKR
jgi:predicted transcriptional regulator